MPPTLKMPRLAHPDWASCPAFDEIPKIAGQLKQGTYFPDPSPWTFRAFEMNPADVRVIIMGMNPYPTVNSYTQKPNASGYAFALDKSMVNLEYRHWPPSLRIIFQDILLFEEVGSMDPTLSRWREKGVLLLNCALTCLREIPESHLELWSTFTAQLVQYLSNQPGRRIWYFLGDDAKHYQRYVAPFNDVILSSIHPARAARTGESFDGQFKALAKAYKEIFNEEFKYL